MILSGTYLSELQQLVKIVLWVSIPLIVVSMLVVTFLHYRKKNKEVGPQVMGSWQEADDLGEIPSPNEMDRPAQQLPLEESIPAQGTPMANAGFSVLPATYQEMRGLKSIIENLNKEIYLLRQHKQSREEEFSKLEHQLNEARETARIAIQDSRKVEQDYLQLEEKLSKQLVDEKKKFSDHLAEWNMAYKKLEEENLHLQEQMIAIHANPETERNDHSAFEAVEQRLIAKETELEALRNKLADHAYTEDLVKETKLQVDFLQSQLDQRIRQYHQTEQQLQENIRLVNSLRNELVLVRREHESARQEWQSRYEEVSHMEDALQEKQQENNRLLDAIQARHEQVNQFETRIEELSQQFQSQRIIKEKQEIALAGMQQRLDEERHQAECIQQKLNQTQETLGRIYHQLGMLVENDSQGSIDKHGEPERHLEYAG